MRFRTSARAALSTAAIATAALALGASPATAQTAPSIAVTAIDLAGDTIVITNSGAEVVDVNGLVLCNFPVYVPIAGADAIAPGGTITVDAGALGVELEDGQGELGIYLRSEFENPDAIVSYVEWGTAGHQRSSVAVAAGIWDGGVVPAGTTLTATVDTPRAAADWTSDGSTGAADPDLPATGVDAWLLILLAVGLALIAAGVATVGLSGRRRAA